MRLRVLLGQAEEIVSGAAMVIVVAAVCWGVVTRYVTAQPAAWTGEVAAVAFAWCVFVGAAAVAKRAGHVSIDMLTAALSGRVRRWLDLGARLLGIGFCAVSAVLAFRFSLANLDNPSAVLRMPLTVLYLAPAVGFTLMGWRMAERALREKPWAS